jgi:hypothetical protein
MPQAASLSPKLKLNRKDKDMRGIFYIIGVVVVVLVILNFIT